MSTTRSKPPRSATACAQRRCPKWIGLKLPPKASLGIIRPECELTPCRTRIVAALKATATRLQQVGVVLDEPGSYVQPPPERVSSLKVLKAPVFARLNSRSDHALVSERRPRVFVVLPEDHGSTYRGVR